MVPCRFCGTGCMAVTVGARGSTGSSEQSSATRVESAVPEHATSACKPAAAKPAAAKPAHLQSAAAELHASARKPAAAEPAAASAARLQSTATGNESAAAEPAAADLPASACKPATSKPAPAGAACIQSVVTGASTARRKSATAGEPAAAIAAAAGAAAATRNTQHRRARVLWRPSASDTGAHAARARRCARTPACSLGAGTGRGPLRGRGARLWVALRGRHGYVSVLCRGIRGARGVAARVRADRARRVGVRRSAGGRGCACGAGGRRMPAGMQAACQCAALPGRGASRRAFRCARR